MKKQNILSLIVLVCTIHGSLKSQIWNYVAQINAQVATIPYIFEGKVQSVEIYPGDDFGNKLSLSNVQWNGRIGYFYDDNGEEAQGYSLSKIRICKVYKGDLNVEREFEVLTRSFSIQNIYLLITGTKEEPDTVLRYTYSPTSHEPGVDDQIEMPAADYKKKIYFADQLTSINPPAYAGKRHYSNAHFLYEMPFYETVDVQNSSGYWEKKTAYCSLVPYVFDDQNQLQAFLNQIQTINPKPIDYCRPDGTKQTVSISEVGTNQNHIAVYPNPSNGSEVVKIKFDLQEESQVSIILTDITGKVIVNSSLGSQKNVDYDLITTVERGIYLLQINYGQNKQSFKITKN